MIKLIEDNKDGITNFIKSIANFFVSIAQHGKLAISILSGVAAGFVALNVALAITAPASVGVAGGIGAITAAFSALNVATGGIILAIGFVAMALVGLALNLEKLKPKFEDTTLKAKELHKAMNDNYKSMEAQRNAAKKLLIEYKELSEKSQKTREEQERLKNILNELKSVYPELTDKIILNNGSLKNLNATLYDYIDTVSKVSLVEAERVIASERELRLQYEKEKYALKNALTLYRADEEEKKISAKERLKQIEDEITLSLERQANAEIQRSEIEIKALKAMQGRIEKEEELIDIKNEGNISSSTQSTTTEKDPIEELNKKYKYEKELLNKRKMDEEEKNKALEELDKNYYTNLLNVATDTYVNLNKEGKNRTQSEKENLNKLVGYTNEATKKLKELNKKKETEDPIKKLEAEYKARKELINNTVEDEKEKKNLLLQNEINFNSQKLQLLEQNAQAIYALSDEERAKRQEDLAKLEEDIKETRATLDNLNDTPKMTIAEAFAQEWQNIVGMAQNAVNSITNIWSTMWSNNLQVVEDTLKDELDTIDKTLNEELEAIDKKLEKEQEMYDNRIKDIEDREKEREKIITETEEAIADINEEIGEHTTEENYNRLIEQREALEEKLKAEQEALIADEQMRSQLEEEKRIKEEQTEIQKDEAEKRAKEKREEEEKKAAIKKAEIQRKQAIMDKATGIFNATVALASGIASAAAAGAATGIAAPIMIPLFVSLVVASAAGQIAAIAATPLPEIPSFAEGGYVPDSNELQFKHIVGSPPNKKDKTLVWASKGERILNHDETKQWEFIKSQELKYITNNNMRNNNPVINMGGITVNAGNTKDANKLAKLSGKAIAKEVVTAITR